MNKKDYFTFEEISVKWGLNDKDIRRLIITKKIIPSFFIARPSHKVQFELIDENTWKPIGVNYVGDNERRGLSEDLFFIREFFYLVHPVVENSFECFFLFFSKDKFHRKGPEELNQCFYVSTHLDNPYRNSIALGDVISHGVLMSDEVDRYEELNSELDNHSTIKSKKIGKWPWGNYSTKMLEILELAAIRWWVDYDEKDITTAPKTQEVILWLENTHGMTTNQAKCIATILRSEKLRTGPRK